jgi:cellulose synthase/poly-beta-1,6-N-acetylglucosamine synthase-like glycosyltransferase
MTVSIIIAVKTWQKNLEECVAKCRQLDYPDFEIIVLPDEPIPELAKSDSFPPIKVIPTGSVNPADKRDQAASVAKGDILAFIDDDAYPARDWLTNAIKNFDDQSVAAVGGPAVTPPEDTLLEQASGRIYVSFIVSGNLVYRYIPGRKRLVDDFPSCNLFVRKEIMLKVGGFDTRLWPGEDTKLCLDITKKLKQKIIYDPRVLVFHHRRSIFRGHFRQIANYALHRGYFVRKFPETSLRLSYFIPSLLSIFLALGFVPAVFNLIFYHMYITTLSLYFILVFLFSLTKRITLIPLVFLGTILTHLTYGFYFLKGLLSQRLKEEVNP